MIPNGGSPCSPDLPIMALLQRGKLQHIDICLRPHRDTQNHAEGHTGRQTLRHTDILIQRDTGRQTLRETQRHSYRETKTDSYRETHTEAHTETQRETHRQTDRLSAKMPTQSLSWTLCIIRGVAQLTLSVLPSAAPEGTCCGIASSNTCCSLSRSVGTDEERRDVLFFSLDTLLRMLPTSPGNTSN